jgi:hypothetical protein
MTGSFLPSAQKLRVEIGGWSSYFQSCKRNQDWEWVLETLGDAFSSLLFFKKNEKLIDLQIF